METPVTNPAAPPPPIQLIPAIDLMDGQVVRLEQGDPKRRTIYDRTPAAMAREFTAAGVERIHVVDLDGAFQGSPRNLASIAEIRAATTAKIEVGGGIRTPDDLQRLFDAGVDYAIIGTKALEDMDFLAASVARHGDRIIAGADARDGFLSTRGWTVQTEASAREYITTLREKTGIATVIYTDIARDGMFSAPNYTALADILDIPALQVIASGGVGIINHLRELRAMRRPNLLGAITGKALYDGRINLPDAVAACTSAA